jgi:hypothetical protein
MKFTWARRDANGYECSSKGDRRFSAFSARLSDGRTIEEHYQCDVKGYQPGGTDWRLGKGKPPIREVDLWAEYLALWRRWSDMNVYSMIDLHNILLERKITVLTDCFANTPVNQARAMAELLNEMHPNGPDQQ